MSDEKYLTEQNKITKGLKYNFIDVFFKEIIQFVIKIILARLLMPEDFGIMGMAIIFTGLINTFSELGFGSALIQVKQKDIDSRYYTTIFTINFVLNIILYIFVYFGLSKFAAIFYENSNLLYIIRILSLPLLINSFVMINKVVLIREMNFKPFTIAGIISSLFSGIIAILLAFNGYAYWSLVIQSVVSSFLLAVVITLYSKWKIKFGFNKDIFNKVFGFSFFIALYKFFSYITKNIDYFIVGKLLGDFSLGIYTLAFILTDTFRSKISDITNKVYFPAMSRVQDNIKHIKDYYLKSVSFNTFFIFPIMIFEIIYAESIVLLFGEQWTNAILPLQIISIAVIIHIFGGSTGSVFRALGKPKTEFYIYLVKTITITVPAIVILTNMYGIVGSAIAVLIHKIAGRIIFQMYMKKIIGLKFKRIIKNLKPILLSSLTMALFLLLMNIMLNSNIYILVLVVFVGFITYISSYILYSGKISFKDFYYLVIGILKGKESIEKLFDLI